MVYSKTIFGTTRPVEIGHFLTGTNTENKEVKHIQIHKEKLCPLSQSRDIIQSQENKTYLKGGADRKSRFKSTKSEPH